MRIDYYTLISVIGAALAFAMKQKKMDIDAKKGEIQMLLRALSEHRAQIGNAVAELTRLLTQAEELGGKDEFLKTFTEARETPPVSLSASAQFRLENLKRRLFMAQTREADLREQFAAVLQERSSELFALKLLVDEATQLRSAIAK